MILLLLKVTFTEKFKNDSINGTSKIILQEFSDILLLNSYFRSFQRAGSLKICTIRRNWNATTGFHSCLAHIPGIFLVLRALSLWYDHYDD